MPVAAPLHAAAAVCAQPQPAIAQPDAKPIPERRNPRRVMVLGAGSDMDGLPNALVGSAPADIRHGRIDVRVGGMRQLA
jgi:hypothetical protein